MNTKARAAVPETHQGYWRRVLRPLSWWLLLVLLLYGIRLHQRLGSETNVRFTASVPGQSAFSKTTAQLDGQPFASGEQVAIGWHRLAIMHPKGKPFAANLFIWYGQHNLGALTLQRTAGSLNIIATPPAQSVKVEGPELRKELANVSSEKLAAPADEYTVTAVYPYFTVEKTITVADNQEALCAITPAVGVLQANFGHAGARFELRRLENSQPQYQVLERGALPATLTGLQAGQYELRAIYQGLVANRSVEITAAHTNQLDVEFLLGNISIETKPAGATVRDAERNELGKTPFNLTGVPAGVWRGEVVLTNCMPVPFAVTVLAKQTATLQTNLMRRSLATAMALLEQSRQESSENLAPVIEAFTAALKDDPENVGCRRS